MKKTVNDSIYSKITQSIRWTTQSIPWMTRSIRKIKMSKTPTDCFFLNKKSQKMNLLLEPHVGTNKGIAGSGRCTQYFSGLTLGRSLRSLPTKDMDLWIPGFLDSKITENKSLVGTVPPIPPLEWNSKEGLYRMQASEASFFHQICCYMKNLMKIG